MKHYILSPDGKPVEEPDYEQWHAWHLTHAAQCLVGAVEVDGSLISTIFHGEVEDGSTHYWETRVFGGALDQVTDRCTGTREQAEAMHAQMLARVRNLK